ncbi:protein kinase domain-containing protein [Rubrivirga sp.]|uniref:protein kinase domain-containing protein n=1 Tax=Rubrivirga sp. TaxID=1885344 RepID=UPI003B517902
MGSSEGASDPASPSERRAGAAPRRDPYGLRGTTVAHYAVEDVIGGGGMGVVYRAQDTRLRRTVALKFLPPAVTADPATERRFVAEARAASALDHPHICTVHEIGETDDGRPFIAMAYVPGVSLRSRLSDGPLSTDEAIGLAAQVARGLACAHRAGIVHRDVKPANVMVTPEGQAKLVDFGVAKAADVLLTQAGTTLGTVAYMSPEQTRGEPVDARADQWALGVVLYEMLSGRRPFRGAYDQAVVYSILHEDPAPLADDVPAGLAAVVERCLEKDPADRYSDTDALADALDAFRQSTAAPLAAGLDAEAPARPQRQTGFPSFGEIRERKLVQWGVAYLAGAWVVLQVVIALGGVYGWPGPLLRAVPVVLAVGLVGALVVAWYHGEQGRQRASGVEAGILAALLGVAGLGVAVVGPGTGAAERGVALASGIQQVAVLPFTNVGGDAENQAFIDGLVYTIGASLTEMEEFSDRLSVLPTDDARASEDASARESAERLGADLVVSGSVQRADDRVRLTMEVYDAATDRRLGSRVLDKTTTDLLALQDSVALVLASLLDVELTEAARMVLAAGGTDSPQAFDLYTRARGTLLNYETEATIDRAIALFERALDADDRYALAWAGLGEAFWRKYEASNDPQWVDRAADAGERAVELNPDLSPVRVTLGMIYKGTGRYADAERELRRALALDDTDALAHQQLGATLYFLGRIGEAEGEYRRAIALKPGYWGFYNTLGNVYLYERRFEEAIAQYRRVVALKPDNPWGYTNIGDAYRNLGRLDSAAVWYRRGVEANPSAAGPTADAYTGLGRVEFDRRDYGNAVRSFRRAVALDSAESDRWYLLGNAHHFAGQQVEAERAWRRMVALDAQAVEVNPSDENGLIGLAHGYAWTDRPEQARNALRRLEALPQKRPYTHLIMAQAYERLGDRASALASLGEGLAQGLNPDEIDRSPWLGELRADPQAARLPRTPGGS